MDAILSVVCDEPGGKVTRNVYPLLFTPENIKKFYEKVSQFPVLSGKPIGSLKEFLDYVIQYTESGEPELKGVFWVIDDFVGVFYLTNIYPDEADAHFAFFDRRFKGRDKLVKEMMKYTFSTYKFHRISAHLATYIGKNVMRFVSAIGFSLEGKRREAVEYHGKKFDMLMYGILATEVLDGD